MMNSLSLLAARYGIEESFRDARGILQTTTPATRQALLAAMGVEADSESKARAALEALDREEWLRPVPPVLVSFGARVELPIIYPTGTESVTWRLELEGGEERSGEASFNSLPLFHRREIDGQSREQRSLRVDAEIPLGYHRLLLAPGDAESTLIITPGKCWLPPQLEQGKRLWGIAAQLYLLNSKTNWGIGDFSDLRDLAQILVPAGAQAIGLNPLHAMFRDAPEHASPYSPASRLLLNVLNIDVVAVAEATSSHKALQAIAAVEFQRELQAVRESALIDYSRVTRMKMSILKIIYDSVANDDRSSEWQRFAAFRRDANPSVERGGLFLALREYFATQEPSRPDWREWPAEYKNPQSAAVRQFADEHHDRVTFEMWLQFLADAQLGEAARAADPMAIGLYRDLAVGADPSGGETWNNQQAVVTQAQVGAPPDIHNPAGQDWGLPPFHPMALKKEGYRSFIDLLRANMRHAGGLRIDHVMALQQLYWVPRGAGADHGAYVRYPREDLIGILALESHRNECLVVGEDLGTVPAGFRERMTEAQILSYRVLFFEKDESGFVPPARYPPLSLAVAGSHDLPTLRGWLLGGDIALKDRLGLYPSSKLKKEAELDRDFDRKELFAALRDTGFVGGPEISSDQFAQAAHRFLASSASAITMIQLDDVTQETTPVNVPATSTQHPNWRRRLSKSLEDIAEAPGFDSLADLLNETRRADVPTISSVPKRSLGQDVWTGTYRLQLHDEFPLAAARAVLPYLKALGVSHVYLSPCLQATPGSKHGYDVTDPTKISADLGGEEGWSAFVAAAQQHGLGILLDIVPNHMAATAQNAWWDDLLAQGPYSRFAQFFDVRIAEGAPFKIELCTLAHAYGEALKANELKLALMGGRVRVQHFDNSWPLSVSSCGELLNHGRHEAQEGTKASGEHCFARLAQLHTIPIPSEEERDFYQRCQIQAQSLLDQSLDRDELGGAIDRANQDPMTLNGILSRQFYALHQWTLSGELTNYRRFFEVDSLVGVRTELEAVFSATHARIQTMLAQGQLDGLRVDHPDGLADPKGYFERLRSLLPTARIYVEKILENDERLDVSWNLDGTVGYDFLAKANRLWMDDSRIDALTSIYHDFTGHSVNVGALVRQKQREVLETSFFGELNRLTELLVRIARSDSESSDLSPRGLRDALAALTAALPIYRTYRTGAAITGNDARMLRETIQTARLASPLVESGIFDFLETMICKARLSELEATFITQWQQLTPAVMAKGVEDTTFYVYDRLLSCNEVGSSASMLGISSDKFHEYCHYLSEHWPQNLLATSTHDNKRSEDVRTRISLLSEIPERWAEVLHEWSGINNEAWRNRNPDRHAEYLLYQTMIGAWPISEERCWQYMLKALREAKINTSWHKPNAAYEEKIQIFTKNIFKNEQFIGSLEGFVAPLILPGRINSLSQTLLKLIVPGVPDFYQGSELWDLSLVDPDNRRAVDYTLRFRLLQECEGMGAVAVLRDWEAGLPKLWMISRVLAFRADHPEVFSAESKYQPMAAGGARLSNLFSCRRGDNLIAVVPRFGMSVADDWQDTQLPLPKGEWRNLFSGALASSSVLPAQLFADFPVAVLIRSEASSS